MGFCALEKSVGAPKSVTVLFQFIHRTGDEGSRKCIKCLNPPLFFKFLWVVGEAFSLSHGLQQQLLKHTGTGARWEGKNEKTLQSCSIPMAKNPTAFSVAVPNFCTSSCTCCLTFWKKIRNKTLHWAQASSTHTENARDVAKLQKKKHGNLKQATKGVRRISKASHKSKVSLFWIDCFHQFFFLHDF